MGLTFKHTFQIERDTFLLIAQTRGWSVVEWERKSGPVVAWAVCNPPPWKRGWTIAQYLIGNYSPVTQCFHTNMAPKKPDHRVKPWCRCCT